MIPINSFFKNYQTNYFRYQQIINKDALDNIDHWVDKFQDDSKSNDKYQVTQIIKSHIRFNYLHCIDTLFELVFGLFPRDGKINDFDLPIILAKSNDRFNNPRLKKLANGNEAFINDFEQEISYGDKKTTLLRYIFFYQINEVNSLNNDLLENIDQSLKHILKLLEIFAKDLNDRSEYNSLKHALRVFPFSGSLKIFNPDTNKPIAGVDMENAHQFITENKGDIKITSKNFDSERDFKYTMIASNMIWNIIKIREKFLSDESKTTNCYVYFFEDDEYKEIEKSYFHKQKIEIKLK